MKILFACQYYAPGVSGVSRVVQEYSENLFKLGHDVSVATSKLNFLEQEVLNGVKINRFDISGNFVVGIKGEIQKYLTFINNNEFDIIVIYAAQQWSFDCLIPVIKEIKSKLVHIPCGYSCLYNKKYSVYFKIMPDVLKEIDLLIFHASQYRDIEFAKAIGLSNYLILSNGASDGEFEKCPIEDIRAKLKVAETDFIFLTVGSPPTLKGHKDLLKSYDCLDVNFPTTLILNGNYDTGLSFKNFLKYLLQMSDRQTIRLAKKISKKNNKKVLITNLKREEVISLFFKANLFVLSSHVEYSPLVLFEATASGLPFLSLSVGNSDEISKWTKGGEVIYVKKDKFGNAIVDHMELAIKMRDLALDADKRKLYAHNGRESWGKKYKWSIICQKLEKILQKTCLI